MQSHFHIRDEKRKHFDVKEKTNIFIPKKNGANRSSSLLSILKNIEWRNGKGRGMVEGKREGKRNRGKERERKGKKKG